MTDNRKEGATRDESARMLLLDHLIYACNFTRFLLP